MIELFATVLQNYLHPANLLLVTFGVFMGITVGSIPGLTGAMAVAVLTSFTFGMSMDGALALLLGVYNGAVYGGSISAILLNVPGTSAAVMTGLDGNPMAKRGEGGKAIGIATVSSFCGGIISCVFLILGCTFIASIAMKFSYPELFVLAFFGLCVIANASAKSLLKGLVASCLGVFISIIGMDALTAVPRFTFGSLHLLSGIDQVPALIGLFGVSELIDQVMHIHTDRPVRQRIDRIFPGWPVLNRLKGVILRASVIGTGVGALPGAGGPIAAFISYNDARGRSKRPELFGTGIPEGIASCESANNATTGGALIPMLSLAVPGDSVTAILMSAFAIHGVRLGPTIFTESPEVVYGVYTYSIIANCIMLILGLIAARFFARILDLDRKLLLPVILLICMIGSFASANSAFNILAMLVFGVLGYGLKRVDIPPASMILGIVLGAMAEKNFRSALTMSKGSYHVFFRPIPLVFWALLLLMVVWPRVKKYIARKKGAGDGGSDAPSALM